MTDPNPTGDTILVYVYAPSIITGHRLVTGTPLTLLPDTARRLDRDHEDPTTGIKTHVLVVFEDDVEASGWLAPNPERCPLCGGQGAITVREGTLPRDKHGDPDAFPLEELVAAYLEGRKPVPVQDDVVDVRRPCPLCRAIDYALLMDEQVGSKW
jgi:hypothetical protein